jgi:hypothetical protein
MDVTIGKEFSGKGGGNTLVGSKVISLPEHLNS